MTAKDKVFPGRVIFDHLPKTAGTAINSWLLNSLGSACVVGGLIDEHRSLINKFGGTYSVISAHVSYTGGGLDSRYEYVTFFREPIDRALSWIFYVLNNHGDSDIKELRQGINRFVETEGAEGSEFVGSNLYVEHFCSVRGGRPVNDEEALSLAFDVLEEYALWGLYERMPDFLADFAAFLGVPAPERIAPVNVTRDRPRNEALSPAIRARLAELNALDIEFYRRLQAFYDKARKRWQQPPVSQSRWAKVDAPPPRREFAQDFVLLRVDQYGGRHVDQHAILSFELKFSLTRPVESLQCGIHVHDETGAWAFGTDSTLTGTAIGPLQAGTHCIRHSLVADLPEGKYDVGFSFIEKRNEGDCLLAWVDKVAFFQISLRRHLPGVGYCSLPSAMTCWTVDDRVMRRVDDGCGAVELSWDEKAVASGQQWTMPARVINRSGQAWRGTQFHPLNLSYHWLNEAGETVIFDGLRTPLPDIAAGASVDVTLSVEAPRVPGRYRLVVVPVQEAHAWLDEKGFTPGECRVEVQIPFNTASEASNEAAR